MQYIHNGIAILLANDIFRYVVSNFLIALEKSLQGQLPLEQSFMIGNVGRFFSEKTFVGMNELEKENDIFSQYWVWSSPNSVQTWLYNKDNKIYFEISETYPWLFSEPEEDDVYVSFDDYINNYKPIMLIELQELLVQSWVNECREILCKMETVK